MSGSPLRDRGVVMEESVFLFRNATIPPDVGMTKIEGKQDVVSTPCLSDSQNQLAFYMAGFAIGMGG